MTDSRGSPHRERHYQKVTGKTQRNFLASFIGSRQRSGNVAQSGHAASRVRQDQRGLGRPAHAEGGIVPSHATCPAGSCSGLIWYSTSVSGSNGQEPVRAAWRHEHRVHFRGVEYHGRPRAVRRAVLIAGRSPHRNARPHITRTSFASVVRRCLEMHAAQRVAHGVARQADLPGPGNRDDAGARRTRVGQ